MALKLRLILAFSIVLALVMLAGTAYFIRGARDDVRIELQSTMQLTVHFLDAELSRLAGTAVADSGRLFNLESLKQIRHLKVEFFDTHGRLVETNQTPMGPVRAAPAWFVALAAPSASSLEAVRRPVWVAGERRGELVVSPEPANEVGEIWQDSKELLQLSVLLFITVSAVMYGVVIRALRPVDRILAALNEMRSGNLRTRLPRFALPELSQISGEFNRMADTLEQSVLQNQRLTRRLIHVQEEEQRRLARELHDELGQNLSAIHADAVAISRHGEEKYPPIRDSAAAIVNVTRRILASVRTMLQRLRPETLDALGLREALGELVSTWRQRYPQVDCTLRLEGELESLGEAANITVYRIVQESLTNIARHAQAHKVVIGLSRSSAAGPVQLRVADDGVGAILAANEPGFGLLGIRERVTALDGRLVIETEPGHGFRLFVELPALRQIEAT
jgi:two-component system sensor histidine kinase UhpB